MDHTSYPHLVDLVLSHAHRSVRVAFRQTCSYYRSSVIVDDHLVLSHVRDPDHHWQEPALQEFPDTPLPCALQPSINHDRYGGERFYQIRRVSPRVLDIRDSCIKLQLKLPRPPRERSSGSRSPCTPGMFNPQVVRFVPVQHDRPIQTSRQCFLVQSLAPQTLVVFTSVRAEKGWGNQCGGSIKTLVLNMDLEHHITWPKLDWGLEWGSIDFLEVERFVIIFNPPASPVKQADLDACLAHVVIVIGTTGTWYNDITGLGQQIVFVGLDAVAPDLDHTLHTLRNKILYTASTQLLLQDEDQQDRILHYLYNSDRFAFMTRDEYAATLSPDEWRLQTVM